ncbi:MAG: hypothetical protein WCD37_16155 [Chloroflexia bacterium]
MRVERGGIARYLKRGQLPSDPDPTVQAIKQEMVRGAASGLTSLGEGEFARLTRINKGQ